MLQLNSVPHIDRALVGRVNDLPVVQQQLLAPALHLLTLTGPPGVGKTSLALAAVQTLQPHFADGIHFVDLAPLLTAQDVPSAIGHVLNIRESTTSSVEAMLLHQLRERALLLVLDNFEHVLPAARFLSELLNHCRALKVLVTSREPLRLRAEHVFTVEALHLPDLQNLPTVEMLAQNPAVSLFIDAARARRHSFALTPENAGVVAEICVALGGLPLAIELAAAWITLFDAATLLDHLYGQLPTPPWRVYDLPERHQTLHAAIDWSVALLGEQERAFFEQMGIFRSGWTIEAARAISGIENMGTLLTLSSALVDKNLIRTVVEPQAEPRFSMLEPIRRYALASLHATDRAKEVAQRHAAYFTEFVEHRTTQLEDGQQQAAIHQIMLEYDDIRQALEWSTSGEAALSGATLSIAATDDQHSHAAAALALRLALALWSYWYICGNFSAGRQWLALALETADGAGVAITPPIRALVLRRMAVLASRKGEYTWAIQVLGEVLTQYRDLNNHHGIATVLTDLGDVQWQQENEHANVQALWEQALGIWRGIGDRAGIARCTNNLGLVALEQGNYQRAQAYAEESILLWRALGNQFFLAESLNSLGLTQHWQGKTQQAAEQFTEAIAIRRQLQDVVGELLVLNNLGLSLLHQQSIGDALLMLQQSLPRAYAEDDTRVLALVLEGGMRILAAAGQLEMAAYFGGAADAIRPAHRLLTAPAAVAEHEQAMKYLKRHFGPIKFAVAWSRGHSLSADELVARLQQLDPHQIAAAPADAADNPLTPREQEVLELVAKGLSNRDIARELVISTGTVNVHLANTYAKLFVSSRTAAVHAARASGWL